MHVLVTDHATADKLLDSIRELDGLPIDFHLGAHHKDDFTHADLIVASPAIPPANEFLVAAREAGVPITTEIRLFVERCPATVLGVTGTKGKSTTTALLGEMLKTRFTTWVGGNIGKSLLPDLNKIDKTHVVVLELSSYMLEHLGAMHWSPHVSVVTMLAADHVEWHGSVDAYINAKANIVRYQRPDDIAVLNEENAEAMGFARLTPAHVVSFGLQGRRPFDLLLHGRHNQVNAQAAYAAADALGVSWDEAQQAVRNFAGLAHRLQLIHKSNGVHFCNDSIATIPEAAIAALESFPPKRVIQIVGGYDHKLPITRTMLQRGAGEAGQGDSLHRQNGRPDRRPLRRLAPCHCRRRLPLRRSCNGGAHGQANRRGGRYRAAEHRIQELRSIRQLRAARGGV